MPRPPKEDLLRLMELLEALSKYLGCLSDEGKDIRVVQRLVARELGFLVWGETQPVQTREM